MKKNADKIINVKLPMSENSEADSRLFNTYKGSNAKQYLLHRWMRAGLVLDEALLLDLIIGMGDDPQFRALSGLERTKYIARQLTDIFNMGGNDNAQQGFTRTEPMPAPEQPPASTAPVTAPPAEAAQAPAPAKDEPADLTRMQTQVKAAVTVPKAALPKMKLD
ncbi:hypothetical protein [Thaumasiovibrio sp. DFM-14]|uniref:hypothetical protein n=1 Tax=Thaumasiovibrio sp. DFM-14 TaxID=3384792 RepID=UPI0039A2B8C2